MSNKNILLSGIHDQLLTRQQITAKLETLPPVPGDLAGVSSIECLAKALDIWKLHVHLLQEARLAETMQLMIRGVYDQLDPSSSLAWRTVGGDPNIPRDLPRMTPVSAAVLGIPGVGKTTSIEACLRLFPQTVWHQPFPRLQNGLLQVPYLSVDVPASGNAEFFAERLAEKWKIATGSTRFDSFLAAKGKRDGMRMLNEWRQVANSHFLALLHLDEIQNLFKLPSLAKRKAHKADDDVQLSIVEDQCVKWILDLMNTWHVGLLISGTPDGVTALMSRFSNSQRLSAYGAHIFRRFTSGDKQFSDLFLPELVKYQYVKKRLSLSDELRDTLIDLSAGVHRILVMVWLAGHRHAHERRKGDLLIEDFRAGADIFLPHIKPAVLALNRGDPAGIRRFTDMVASNGAFWSMTG